MQLAPEDLAEALDITLLAETAQMPSSGNSVTYQTATGWSIFSTTKPQIVDRFVEQKLPDFQRMCLLARVNDTVMWSKTECFSAGQRLWSVEHSGEDGNTRHLVEHGALPAQFSGITARNFAEQDKEDAGEAQVDFGFEIPIELWESFTGVRYDEAPDDDGASARFSSVAMPKTTGTLGRRLKRLMGQGS